MIEGYTRCNREKELYCRNTNLYSRRVGTGVNSYLMDLGDSGFLSKVCHPYNCIA